MLLEGNDSAKDLSDEEVLKRSQAKPWLYAVLLDRYQDAFMRKARSILRNELDAEEVVQDAFTKIYMNADKFVPQEGATLTSSTVVFEWSEGVNVSEYWLSVATNPDWISGYSWSDIWDQSAGTNLSVEVSGIPLNGQEVYAAIWFKKNGSWHLGNIHSYMTIVE